MTSLSDKIYFKAKKLNVKEWVLWLVDKLSCSHCLPFWLTIFMSFGSDSFLLEIFINILVVKLAIKYT